MTLEAARQCPAYPMLRPDPLAPPPELAQLRRESPLTRVRLWDGSTPWLVTSYDLARQVCADSRFSSNARTPGYPHLSAGSGVLKMGDTSMLRMDDPEHRIHRRLVLPEFSPRRAESYAPAIEAEVDRLLTEMLAMEPPVDFVEAFALPLPSIVICELLGVPYELHEQFHRWTNIRVAANATPEDVESTTQSLLDMFDDLVTRKEKDPEDDLISRLIVAGRLPDAGRVLSHDELVMMANLILSAGFETTANMLALSVLTLSRHPEQAAELRADPSLMPMAVEELLRYVSIAHVTPARVAADDVEIGGVVIRRGEGVFVPLIAANWDDTVFPEPDRFDIHREGSRNQVGFGFGSHQCLGQTLARVELRIALQAILERVPSIRVAAPVADLPFKHGAIFFGLYGLPVEW